MENNEFLSKPKEISRRLVISAVDKLKEVELYNAADRITAILKRSPDGIFDDKYNWEFKPMLELLLREIINIADKPGLSNEARLNMVDEAFKLSGFEDESAK